MKIQDFDSEVNALFEEDSVLAQAVVNLQERRKRISAENKDENNNILNNTLVSMENRGTSDKKQVSSVDYGIDLSEKAFSLSITDEEKDDDADLSLFETEALAVDPADVIPYESFIAQEPKKKKLFEKRENEQTEPIKLLDFVASAKKNDDLPVASDETENDDTDKTDDGAIEPAEESSEGIEASDGESETAEEHTESEVIANETKDTELIIPAPHEETALPDSATNSVISDNGYSVTDAEEEPTPFITTGPLNYSENDSPFLAEYTPAPEPSAENAEVSDAPPTEKTTSPELEKDNIEDNEANDESFNEEVLDNYEIDDSNADQKTKARFIDSVFDFVELFIFSLAAVLLITTFFFRHSVVDGSSMEQTLFDGEHIIISNLFYEPKRGDIIVCEDYTTQLRKPIVKRIIAIPGDTIEFKNDGFASSVYVNGELIEEDYVFMDGYDFTPSGSWVVNEGEVFVMGDHRNNSTDSRTIGTVRIDSIIGKALFRFYPKEKFGKIE